MDPTANLAEQLAIVAEMLAEDSEHIDTGQAVRLAELVSVLHGWLSGGGALPRAWERDANPIPKPWRE